MRFLNLFLTGGMRGPINARDEHRMIQRRPRGSFDWGKENQKTKRADLPRSTRQVGSIKSLLSRLNYFRVSTQRNSAMRRSGV